MTHRGPATRGPGAAHEQQRHNILEAVFTLVDTQGTQQVSIRNVAKAADVSVGRVQHYFPTKDALLSAAFAAVNEAGTQGVHQRLAAQGIADSEATAVAVLTELIPRDEDRRRLFRVARAFEVYALTRPELGRRLTQDYEALIALIAGLLHRDAAASVTSGSEEALDSARELIALATGLAGMVLTDNIDPDRAGHLLADRAHQVFAARDDRG